MRHPHSDNSYVNPRVLKVNVGFLLAEGAGYSRTTTLDVPQRLRVADDLLVESLFGDLRLTRTSKGILVQGHLECQITAHCTRCLTPVILAVPLQLEELFSTTDQDGTDFTIDDDNVLDLAPLIREETIIQTPQKIHCRPDCQGLCSDCGINLNTQQCNCAQQNIDPRWAALSQLQQQLADED